MTDSNKTYLFRITHIENVPHILQHGITHSTSLNANPNFVSIGDSSLISTRSNYLLNNGRRLGDYIPFYFSYRTPMLYVIQKGFNLVAPTTAENIVYCVSSIQKIIEQNLEFVFTDGHAVDSFSSQYTQNDIENIDNILDYKAIKERYWIDENDLDKKRRKEAEFLISGDIAVDSILGYLVYNQISKDRMISFGLEDKSVYIKSGYYFEI
jgi:hypothetical protein